MPAPEETICASVERLVARSSESFASRAPESVADRESLRAKAVPLLEEQDRLVVEVAHRDALLPRERVPARQRDDERILGDDARCPLPAEVRLECQQACVEPPLAQIVDELVGLLLAEHELHLRIPRAHGGNDFGQEVGRNGRDDADPERARARLAEELRGGDEVVNLKENPPCVLDHDLARGGQEHVPPVPLGESAPRARLRAASPARSAWAARRGTSLPLCGSRASRRPRRRTGAGGERGHGRW